VAHHNVTDYITAPALHLQHEDGVWLHPVDGVHGPQVQAGQGRAPKASLYRGKMQVLVGLAAALVWMQQAGTSRQKCELRCRLRAAATAAPHPPEDLFVVRLVDQVIHHHTL
jgi:hypothetical protein